MEIRVRKAVEADAVQMAELSEQRRIQYQVDQPVFWRKAQDSRQVQTPFLATQIANADIIALVSEGEATLSGFVIADLRSGKVCEIDDFCVATPAAWATVGKALLEAVSQAAKVRSITSYEVVCGHLDQLKRAMLKNFGLAVDHYWFTAPLASAMEQTMPRQVRVVQRSDVAQMASLSAQDRTEYAEIGRNNTAVLVYAEGGHMLGYVIGLVVASPPVYDPGGQTCLVIEFVVGQITDWPTVGKVLLEALGQKAQTLGAVQTVVICDAADQPKQAMLRDSGLTIASEWYQ